MPYNYMIEEYLSILSDYEDVSDLEAAWMAGVTDIREELCERIEAHDDGLTWMREELGLDG